jgi:hypothetical protein
MVDWQAIGPYVVAVITGGVAWATAKIQHKGKPENALIDQLQEEMGTMRKDIADLKSEQQKSRKRERIRDDYINKLRRHIEAGMPPPPPEWPEGLYD